MVIEILASETLVMNKVKLHEPYSLIFKLESDRSDDLFIKN